MRKRSKIKGLITLAAAACCTLGVAVFTGSAESGAETKAVFKTKDGASVRLTSSDEKYGIRFAAEISDYNEEITYNMLILPDVYYTEYYNNTGSAQNIVEWAIVKYGKDNLAIVEDCPYNAEEKIVYGSMADIRYDNLNREFCGYAYYESDGKYIVSAEADSPLRSIKDVAEKAILSGDYNAKPEQLNVLNDYVLRAAKQKLGLSAGDKLSLNKSKIYAFENESVSLNFGIDANPRLTSYVSLDESVCTVNENGQVTMVSAGTAKIRATLCGETAECVVNVHENTFDVSNENDLNWFTSDGPEMKIENGALTLTYVNNESPVVKLNRQFSAGDVIEITLKSETVEGVKYSDADCHIYGLTETNDAANEAFYTSESGISANMQEPVVPNIGVNGETHTVTLKLKDSYKGLYIDLHGKQTIYSIKVSPDNNAYDFTDKANFIRFQNAADEAGKISIEQQSDGVFIKAEAIHTEGVSRTVRFFKDFSKGDKLLIESEGSGYVYLYGINRNGDTLVDSFGTNNLAGTKIHSFTANQDDIAGFYLDIHKDGSGNVGTLKIKRIEIIKAGTQTGERNEYSFGSGLSFAADFEADGDTGMAIENGMLKFVKNTNNIVRFRRPFKTGDLVKITLCGEGTDGGYFYAYGNNNDNNAGTDAFAKNINGTFKVEAATYIGGTEKHTVELILQKDYPNGLYFDFHGVQYIENISIVPAKTVFDFDTKEDLSYVAAQAAAKAELADGELKLERTSAKDGENWANFSIPALKTGTQLTLYISSTGGRAFMYGLNADGGVETEAFNQSDGSTPVEIELTSDVSKKISVTAAKDLCGIKFMLSGDEGQVISIDKIVIGEEAEEEKEYALPEYDTSLTMNVGVWNGSYTDFTQEDIDALKEAGINVLVGNFPKSGDFLNMAAKAGISVIPFAKEWSEHTIDFSSESHLSYFQQDKLSVMERATLTEGAQTYDVLHVTAVTGGNVLWFKKPLAAGSEVTITLKAEGDVYAYGINGNQADSGMIAQTKIAGGGAGKTSTTLKVLKDTDGIYIMFNMPDGKAQNEGYIYGIETGTSALPACVRNSAVLGLCVYDEPDDLAALEQTGLTQEAFAALLEENYLSDKIFFVNLLPDYALGTKSEYEEYINAYFEKAKPQVISVDYYALQAGDTVRPTFFSNLNYLAEKAKENDIPLWYTMLTAQHGEYADPTEAQLRWQAAVAMTYGAKGVLHYVYSGDSGYNGMMKQENGEWVKNEELFRKVTAIDSEIALWDHIYMSFEWQKTGTIGSSNLFTDLTALSAMEGKGEISVTSNSGAAICGVFTDENGNYGYMLTNASGDTGATMQVSFGEGYGAVAVIKNGVTSIIKTTDLSAIALAAGEGVFMIPLK